MDWDSIEKQAKNKKGRLIGYRKRASDGAIRNLNSNISIADRYLNIDDKLNGRINRMQDIRDEIKAHKDIMKDRKVKGLVKQGTKYIPSSERGFVFAKGNHETMSPKQVEFTAKMHKAAGKVHNEFLKTQNANSRYARRRVEQQAFEAPAKNNIIPAGEVKDTGKYKTKEPIKKGNKIIGYIKKHPGKSAAIAAGSLATAYAAKKAYDHYKNSHII